MTFEENLKILQERGMEEDSALLLKQAWNSVEMDEQYASMKKTQSILSVITEYINNVNMKLVNSRSMTESERQYELGKRDMANSIGNLFDARDYRERRDGIVREMKRSDDNEK